MTELPAFATHTWLPPTAIYVGSSKIVPAAEELSTKRIDNPLKLSGSGCCDNRLNSPCYLLLICADQHGEGSRCEFVIVDDGLNRMAQMQVNRSIFVTAIVFILIATNVITSDRKSTRLN